MRRDLVLTVHWLDLTWHTNSWDVFLSGWRTFLLGCVEQLNIIGFEESADMRGSLWVRVCVLINRSRWLELTPRLFSQQNWATNTTFPSSRARSLLEKRWDDELLREDETRRCGIMRTKSAGNAGFEEWLILREEAVLCYFSCCCRYLLSSPTINNALGGTMSSSLEDYGGLLQIRRGDSFNGGEGLGN